jgi:hypothetical protein
LSAVGFFSTGRNVCRQLSMCLLTYEELPLGSRSISQIGHFIFAMPMNFSDSAEESLFLSSVNWILGGRS